MAEDYDSRIASLLSHLDPDPKQNIHTIVTKTSELLSCESALYARFDEDGRGSLRIRAACNLPQHPVPAKGPIRDFLQEVMAAAGAEPTWAVNLADRKARPGAVGQPLARRPIPHRAAVRDTKRLHTEEVLRVQPPGLEPTDYESRPLASL